MRNTLLLSLMVLATLLWAAAQHMPQSGGEPTSPGAQVPDATQPQGSTPSSPGQPGAPSGAPAGAPGQMANAPVTEGCLGGSNPNYTVTDSAGKTYKLNIPPGADASTLASHIGEAVAVMGPVNSAAGSNNASIDVSRIGRGTAKCPGSSSSGAQTPPHSQAPPK